MIRDLLVGLGLAAVIEGLVLALAPLRYEDLLRFLAAIPPETRRLLGLGVLAFGVGLVWLGLRLSG